MSTLPPSCILVHYSEIGLKGNNRGFFERKLASNISKAVEGRARVKRLNGRYVVVPKEQQYLAFLLENVAKIFGVRSYSPAYSCNQDIESINETATQLVKQRIEGGNGTGSPSSTISLKVNTRRTDKSFEKTSSDVNNEIGNYLRQRLPVTFSMKNPDVKITIELVGGMSYLYTQKLSGFGGLPVGAEGKVLCLLSGGIDSPVASWLMMRRGCSTEFIHFHPFADDFRDNGPDSISSSPMMAKVSKILSLAEVLSEYCFETRAHFVPFFPFQMRMMAGEEEGDFEKYELVVFKRFMLRVASEVARREKIPALATGDNLGQVASQTLANLVVTDSPTCSMPVFRPLLCYDKEEITNLAKTIGTYEVSLWPYKDCCSILSKHPATAAKRERIEEIERDVDIDKAVKEALEKVVTVSVNGREKNRVWNWQSNILAESA